MFYELRVYRVMPGRMPDVLDRFEKVVFPQWEKYGIRAAGFWTTVIGDCHRDLHQLLVWESLAEREKKFTAFSTDPEFREQMAETEKNGVLVESVSNSILAPTRFSAMN